MHQSGDESVKTKSRRGLEYASGEKRGSNFAAAESRDDPEMPASVSRVGITQHEGIKPIDGIPITRIPPR